MVEFALRNKKILKFLSLNLPENRVGIDIPADSPKGSMGLLNLPTVLDFYIFLW